MTSNNMTFGQRLKRCLSEQNMTQKQLSILLNIPQTTLSAYFLDKRQPDIDTMARLADALNTSVQYLITGKKISPSSLIDELAALLVEPKLRAAYLKLIQLSPEDLEMADQQLDAIVKRYEKTKKQPPSSV